MYLYHVRAQRLQKSGVPELLKLVTDGCEPSVGWEPSPGPLEEQPVLLMNELVRPKQEKYTIQDKGSVGS